MDRLNTKSKDLLEENISKIAELFPNIIIEQEGERKIDFDTLKQELSDTVLEGNEKYQLTWPGKKASILLANTPTTNSLKPAPEESVNYENTENLYIEGDNLEVLKILQESYTGKIKCIYIDPPYNTGNDFVYRDDFSQDKNEYLEETGEIQNGNRLVSNPESSGRYHSNWLSMMYPRLKLARNLLSEDGVIFISIDDNEQSNLKKICDEIFGEINCLAQCVKKRRNSQANLSKNISTVHEYLLIYTKNNYEVLYKLPATINYNEYKNPDNDFRGPYKTMPCTNKGGTIYTIKTPSGNEIRDEWRFKPETFKTLLNDGRIFFSKEGGGKPRYKVYLSEKITEGQLPNTWLDNLSSNQEASIYLKNLFKHSLIFNNPKPTELITFCLKLATQKEAIILDFFSGSATTADAIMQLNAEDNGKRKYIMVQIPEVTPEDSEAYKAGYKNICEIGKERIRRAGKKIKEETGADIDYGFRVYKLTDSIYENTKVSPKDQTQGNLFEENIKPDVEKQEILTSVILDLGLELNLKTEEKGIGETKYFLVDNNYLFACFEKNLDLNKDSEIFQEILRVRPIHIAFIDSVFKNDSDRINFENLLKQYLPECKGVKII